MTLRKRIWQWNVRPKRTFKTQVGLTPRGDFFQAESLKFDWYSNIYIDIFCPNIDIEYGNFGYRTCSRAWIVISLPQTDVHELVLDRPLPGLDALTECLDILIPEWRTLKQFCCKWPVTDWPCLLPFLPVRIGYGRGRSGPRYWPMRGPWNSSDSERRKNLIERLEFEREDNKNEFQVFFI
jgi:hypothetical protein